MFLKIVNSLYIHTSLYICKLLHIHKHTCMHMHTHVIYICKNVYKAINIKIILYTYECLQGIHNNLPGSFFKIPCLDLKPDLIRTPEVKIWHAFWESHSGDPSTFTVQKRITALCWFLNLSKPCSFLININILNSTETFQMN